MKKAFTLVELMILTALLGILAAIALPIYQGHITEAKEATAKDTLRILRNTIELYAAQHNGVPPGYPDDDPTSSPSSLRIWLQLIKDEQYLPSLPENPFNKLTTITVIPNDGTLPAEATGASGWIYKPATSDFRIDWPGTDTKDMRFYDY